MFLSILDSYEYEPCIDTINGGIIVVFDHPEDYKVALQRID